MQDYSYVLYRHKRLAFYHFGNKNDYGKSSQNWFCLLESLVTIVIKCMPSINVNI